MTPAPLPALPLEHVLDAMACGLAVLDSQGRVVRWNHWLARHSGIAVETASGRRMNELFPAIAGTRFEQAIAQALHARLPALLSPALHGTLLPLYRNPERPDEQERLHQMTHIVPLRDAPQAGCLIQITDVSAHISRERRLRKEAETLRRERTEDALTGLINRQSFDQHLEAAYAAAWTARRSVLLMLVEIDQFPGYNEALDRDSVNRLLVATGSMLAQQANAHGGIAARYGDDKFAVLLSQAAQAQACTLAHALLADSPQLADLLPDDLPLTLSIGIASLLPMNDAETHTLVSSADIALFQARHDGGNTVVWFDAETATFTACRP